MKWTKLEQLVVLVVLFGAFLKVFMGVNISNEILATPLVILALVRFVKIMFEKGSGL